MTMRILVTRPREDAERFARQLEAKGHDVLVEPLFTIEPEPEAALELDGVQGLLFTSANGARAFAARTERRDLRVFAVGEATADTARELGFAEVESAGGDVEDLARLVRARARPEDGPLLHAAGGVVAGDLAGALEQSGFDVRRAVLYRAEPVAALSGTAIAALREGAVDVATFFSPRTARTFIGLARAAGVEGACARVALLGLSPAVIEAASEIAWAARETAETPSEAALLAALDRLAAQHAVREPAPADRPALAAAAEPRAAPAPQPARARESRAPAMLAAVALIVALATAGWTAWRAMTPQPDATAERLAAIERRGTALERDVASRLAAADQARSDAERRGGAVGDRIAALEQRLATLAEIVNGFAARIARIEEEQKADGDPARLAMLTAENRRLAQELARLQEAVGALDASVGERSEQRRGDSLVLALGQIRELLGRGAPFAGALTTARAFAAEDQIVLQQLAALEPAAERGVPSRAALRERFDRAASEAVRSDRVAGTTGWWRPVAERLSSLVTWRRVDAQGDGADAIVARAEQRLAADDLVGAIAELDKLQGPAAEPMRGWLADARARAAADAAIARLTAHVLRPGAGAQ